MKCPICNGDGWVEYSITNHDLCSNCRGTGTVKRPLFDKLVFTLLLTIAVATIYFMYNYYWQVCIERGGAVQYCLAN